MPGLCFLFCLIAVIAAFAVPKGTRVVVVAAPGAPPARMLSIITRSGGALVAATAHPWIAVAESDGRDFPSRLFSNGAVLVLDGAAAFLCTSESSDP